MMPPQETGSRPETSRHREADMVCLLLLGMIYQHFVINYIHRSEEIIGYCTFDPINFKVLPKVSPSAGAWPPPRGSAQTLT